MRCRFGDAASTNRVIAVDDQNDALPGKGVRIGVMTRRQRNIFYLFVYALLHGPAPLVWAHVVTMDFRAGLAVSAVILMLAHVNLVGATATFVAHTATDPAASSLRLPSVLPTIPSPQWPMCVITTLTGVAVETSPPHDLQPCAHTLSSGHRASLARAVARVSYLASCERPPESSWGTIACLCLCLWLWRWRWLLRIETGARACMAFSR